MNYIGMLTLKGIKPSTLSSETTVFIMVFIVSKQLRRPSQLTRPELVILQRFKFVPKYLRVYTHVGGVFMPFTRPVSMHPFLHTKSASHSCQLDCVLRR
jgi:hypothetical protein